MEIDPKTVALMRSAGIQFVVNARAPGGRMTIVLEPLEVPAFVRDPDQGVADHFGS